MTTTQQGKLTREFIDRLYTQMHNGFTIDRYEFARAIEAEVEARTAKKMEALVEALRDAAKDMRAAAATIDTNPGDAINDTIWHGMVTLYDHLCAGAEQAEATAIAANQQDTVAEKGDK